MGLFLYYEQTISVEKEQEARTKVTTAFQQTETYRITKRRCKPIKSDSNKSRSNKNWKPKTLI